jgi:hypothetical protein
MVAGASAGKAEAVLDSWTQPASAHHQSHSMQYCTRPIQDRWDAGTPGKMKPDQGFESASSRACS